METIVKQAIIQAVKEYQSLHGLKQADIAKKANVNNAYLSLMLRDGSNFMYEASGKQGFIPNVHFYRLAELVGYSLTKEYWQFQPTNQFTAALSALQDAKEFGLTTLIIGDTGCGKTYTAKKFAANNPQDCFIVTVGSSDNLGDLLDKVLDVLKIPAAKTKSAKIRDIARYMKNLKAQGYKPQLIFDESEYMKQPTLCTKKELHDALAGECSITLIGTDQLLQNIEKMRKRNKPGIPQFYRRIKFGIRQLPSIDRTFDQFIRDMDKDMRYFLQRECDNYGELHDALVPTLREADRLGEPLTITLLRKVLNLPDVKAA